MTRNHVHLLGRDAIREPEWTESVAVGGDAFAESVKQALKDVRATWQVMVRRTCRREGVPEEGGTTLQHGFGRQKCASKHCFQAF